MISGFEDDVGISLGPATENFKAGFSEDDAASVFVLSIATLENKGFACSATGSDFVKLVVMADGAENTGFGCGFSGTTGGAKMDLDTTAAAIGTATGALNDSVDGLGGMAKVVFDPSWTLSNRDCCTACE
jgi:hypothetical protein